MTTRLSKPLDEMIADIQTLDLDPIKVKLMDSKEGPGWSLDQTNLMVREYLRFLHLSVKYPDRPIVCSIDVDRVWHAHILDTRKYADDCERVFGFFFHHFPYFGLRGDEDAANLRAAFEESGTLYELEFGEPRPEVRDSSMCGAEGPEPWCRSPTSCARGMLEQDARPRVTSL